MHDLKDTELGEKIKAGCERAFRELYDRYHMQLYYIAKKYVKNPALAEDAVQEVYVKLWQKRVILDNSKSVKGYLFTMLKNRVLNMVRDRKKKIISVSGTEEVVLSNQNSTDDELIYKEYIEIVKNGLDELTGRQREVFELKVNGHSNAQVAKKLKISIRTVKTHYYLSSRFIREYLEKHAHIYFLLLALRISFSLYV